MKDHSAPLTVLEQSVHFLNRPHEGVPAGLITGPWAWRASDLPPLDRLFHRFSDNELRALCAGFNPAPLEPTFAAWRRELLDGRGFVLARGVPVEKWTRIELDLLMRGVAQQFGRLGMQNPQGDLIGEVRNTGAAQRDPYVRNYITDREFRFHCDAADLLGLLCIRKAYKGGRSSLASSVTVYNELAKRRPDLAARLFEPMLLDLRNEQAEGAAGYGALTPCAYAGGRLRTIYISDYFRSVDRHADVALPSTDRELMDIYEEIAAAPENCLSFDLEPGDLLLVNNHVTLHARSAFEDAPGAERLLLRFLVSVGA